MAGIEPPTPAFVAAGAQQVAEKENLTTETQRHS